MYKKAPSWIASAVTRISRLKVVPGYPERKRVLRLLDQSSRARISVFGSGRLSPVSVGAPSLAPSEARARTTFAVKMRSVKMNLKRIDTVDSIFAIRSAGS